MNQETTIPGAAAVPRWVHALAIAAALATFPLIVLGGLVTSYDVGMAVPDAPTTFGHNMLLYPLDQWLEASFGVRLEHGHRLFGALVGLFTLVLCAAMWSDSPRRWLPWLGAVVLASVFARGQLGPGGLLGVGGLTIAAAAVLWARLPSLWMRWLGLVALGLVLAQGGFGALRVVLNDRAVAVIHGCVAQAFFALMACVVLVTSRGWQAVEATVSSGAAKVRRLSLLTAAFVVLQLILGAVLRHLGGVTMLVLHLAFAGLILLHVGLLAKRIFMEHAAVPLLPRLIEVLGGLVLTQLMLGAGAWATSSGFGPYAMSAPTGAQIFFATAHVSIGALIVAVCVVFAVLSFRLLAVPMGQEASAEGRRSGTRSDARSPSLASRPSVSPLEPRELWFSEVPA